MDREQEEAVQRITARYIAELRAGRHLRLSDYLSRYPRYAGAITDFVTYYHTIEKSMPEEAESMPPLSEASRAVLDRAWNQELLSVRATNDSLTATLQVAANNQDKSLPQLVMELEAVRKGQRSHFPLLGFHWLLEPLALQAKVHLNENISYWPLEWPARAKQLTNATWLQKAFRTATSTTAALRQLNELLAV